jgi:branched-chain amino acid transport system substrate-binding protein
VLGTTPSANAGQIFKELDILGYKGIKILANGTYMAGAVPFDGASASEYQRKTNDEARVYLGESLGFSNIGGYDVVHILKAGLEKAQSLDPKDVAGAIPSTRFRTFYGSNQQPMLPAYITQITDGKLVERAKIAPTE